MTNRTVSVTLTAHIAQYMAALRTAGAATAQLAGSATGLARDVGMINTKMAALGTAVAYTMYQGVRQMADFEHAMSLVLATTEATEEQMASLRKAALDVGGVMPYTPTEAADGIAILSKAGVDAADIIGGALTGALNLAAAGEMTVAEASEIAAGALNTFRLAGTEMPHVADLLAAAANEAQGEVHHLGFALRMASAVAAQTGMTIEETTAALAAMANRGLLGSDAGTSLKSFLIHLTPTTDTAAQAMKNIGFEAFDAQGKFVGLEQVAQRLTEGMRDLSQEQQLVTLRTIFGTDAIRAAAVLYEEGADGVEDWINAINREGYAAQFASTLNDNLIGDIKRLRGELNQLFIETGEGAHGPLRELTQGITALLAGMGDLRRGGNFQGNPDELSNFWERAGYWLGLPLLPDPRREDGETLWSGIWHQLFGGGPGDEASRLDEVTNAIQGMDAAVGGLYSNIGTLEVSSTGATGAIGGIGAAADAAAQSVRDLGGAAGGAAGGLAGLDEQMREAIGGAMGYVDAMQAAAGATRGLLSMESELRAAALQPVTVGGSSGGGGGGDSSAASKARTKATNDEIKRRREADRKAMDREIERARAKAKAKAERRADRQAREEVEQGVADFIDTDKKAKRGENIDGFNNTNEVGERTGSLTDKEQKALDKKIEEIRARHKKALDTQVKALREASKAATGTASSTRAYSTSLDENTAAGQRNWKAIDAQVDKIQAHAQAAYNAVMLNGGTVEEAGKAARDALMEGYEALMQAAENAGFATDAVKAYLAELGLIPKEIKTLFKIEVDTKELTEYEKKLAEIQRKAKAGRLPPLDEGQAGTAPTSRRSGGSTFGTPTTKKTTTTTTTVPRGAIGAGYSTGGEIRGPGNGTSDSIPVRLSHGEYVIRASQYAMNRDLVQAINSGDGRVQPGGGGVGVLIEGGVHVTSPKPDRAGANVIDELDMYVYRKGGVR